MRTLDRYLLRLTAVPFLLGILLFLVVLLGDEARKLGAAVTGLRVPLSLILQYLLYAAPHALVWSLPVGALLGVSMAATGAARAGESIAVRTGGVGFLRCWVVGELDAALRLARFDQRYLARGFAWWLECVNPIGSRAGANQTGDR